MMVGHYLGSLFFGGSCDKTILSEVVQQMFIKLLVCTRNHSKHLRYISEQRYFWSSNACILIKEIRQ